MRGRESRQSNAPPASLPKVTSEKRVRHAASKGCGSAGRQQRVQELGLGGKVGWCCRLEGTWGDERALEQTTKRVAREPA